MNKRVFATAAIIFGVGLFMLGAFTYGYHGSGIPEPPSAHPSNYTGWTPFGEAAMILGAMLVTGGALFRH